LFKFIHAADLHIDSPLRGLQKLEDAPTEKLRGATRKALENLVLLAIEEQVDFILIAGDLYDGKWKDHQTGLYFRNQMLELQRHSIHVYLIRGNHDAESEISRYITMPSNVHSFSTSAAESKQHPVLPVTVHGRSFPARAVEDNFATSYPARVDGQFNIGLLHTSLNGSYSEHDTYAPCSVSDLSSKDYDYWALGHVHIPQIVSQEPLIVFSGNTQGRHVREAGERGCWLVSVDLDVVDSQQPVQQEFIPLDVVRWGRVEVDVSGVNDEADIELPVVRSVRPLYEAADGRLLALRVVLVGETTLHYTLHANLQQHIANIRAALQIFGSDNIWLEKTVISTRPEQAIDTMSARDDLSASVIGSVRQELQSAPLNDSDLEQSKLPKDVRDMLKVLPPDVNKQVLDELQGASGLTLMDDIRALVLGSLAIEPRAADTSTAVTHATDTSVTDTRADDRETGESEAAREAAGLTGELW